LDPNGNHKEGHTYIHLLIEWLAKLRPDLRELICCNFNNCIVLKESGRIDISIQDTVSKKAIIFENKINGATDTNRQLPRYFDHLSNKGIEIVAIVYLTLNQIRTPNELSWLPATTEGLSDSEKVKPLLIPAVAFSHSHQCLMTGWIQECERCTNDFDTLSIIRQYRKLIEHLGSNAMNDLLMEKFHKTIVERPEQWQSMQSLLSLLNDLPSYRALRIAKLFENDPRPFENSGIWAKNTAVLSFKNGKGISIDIGCEKDYYIFTFWDRERETYGKERINTAIQGYEKKDTFLWDNVDLKYYKKYSFPAEEICLDTDLKNFMTHLRNINTEEITP